MVIQPEININTTFSIAIASLPQFSFPILGNENKAIQSFWGARREGRKRRYKDLDIFAARGTPVLAVSNGKINSAGEKGLGGKQVWQGIGMLGKSIYYAHLDSNLVSPGKSISVGDTLGYIGNTGNAKTTSPHLHFGIYECYNGAIYPLPFIEKPKVLEKNAAVVLKEQCQVVITGAKANLRNGPATTFKILGEPIRNDTLDLLGTSGDRFHIQKTDNRKEYQFHTLAKAE